MADKALLIGINNYKTVSDLRGCENDVENMKALLTSALGFSTPNVKTLLNEEATKTKINKQMKWIFTGVREGDRVLLHFSGHGSFTADDDHDEDGGADELICLHDMDFDDPESYLLDDDLRHWTKGLPRGGRLLVVLDCCHSGTGTRMMLAEGSRAPRAVDIKATAARAVAPAGDATGSRAMGAEAVALSVEAALDPTSRQAVLARFVPPPQHIVSRIGDRRPRSLLRAIPQTDMNHVLLAACRDDQTAADAYIGTSYNGAFTYFLCKTLRDRGTGVSLRELHSQVGLALSSGRFSQVPQLEGAELDAPLFGGPSKDGASSTSPPTPPVRPPTPDTPVVGRRDEWDLLQRIVGTGDGLTGDDRRRALELFGRLIGVPGVGAGRPGMRATGIRHLLYVHGISTHVAGYSDSWWEAMREHVSTVFGDGALDQTRHEVLWSNLVNERALDALALRTHGEREQLAAEIRDVLQDRVERHLVDATPAASPGELQRSVAGARGGVSIPGLSSIDDFAVYMLNDSIRQEIIARFTEKARSLLETGKELDIISHSWGTVVAYEGLRELEAAGFTQPLVRNFFTVGAALSITPVKWRLRPDNRNGRRPALVRRWVNLNARGDVIGGALQDRPYEVNEDFSALDPVGCRTIFGRAVNPACAHSSYFVRENLAVNRDIFARFISD